MVFARTISLWLQDDPRLDEIRNRPSAIEMLKASVSRSGDCLEDRPPLIIEAEALALVLNPPKRPERLPVSARTNSRPEMPSIRPMVPSVNFKLRATSYYPNQPSRSMALIGEAGSAEGNERWVKEGSSLGRFVIAEIRRGSVTYWDGDHVCEMAVQRRAGLRTIVRDIRPDSRQVSAVVHDRNVLLSASVDTNSIESGGHN
jgi:hypothetical protein